MDKKICDFIDSQKEYFVRDLERLVNINSVRTAPEENAPFGEGCKKVLTEAEKILSEHGFSMTSYESYAGETNLGKAPELMLLAHLDVVPPGDNWTRKPFKMEREGDIVYGRGTTDDKGPAVAMIYALKAVREIYGESEKGVRLVLGCGEETGSEDMDYYFSKRETLPYTLSPDADYPLINIEKGRFAPFFTKTVNPDGNILSINGGDTQNIVPPKADALICGIDPEAVKKYCADTEKETNAEISCEEENGNIRIFVKGTAAHAAQPHKGNNAQTVLLKLLSSLPLKGEAHASCRKLTELFPHGETDGMSIGVKMSDEKSGELTLNFGVLSYSDGIFRCGTDLRVPLAATKENVKDVIKNNLNTAGFSFEDDPEMRPVHFVDENSPLIKTALAVYEDYTGKEGKCLAIGGGTYVHDIEGGVAFGIEFEGKDYRIHSNDEFADINELLLTAKMYAQIIKDLSY